MSVENLRMGLSDLTSAVKEKKAEKAARLEAQQKAAANQAFAEAFSQGLEGQTSLGQAYAQGVSSGIIDPTKAGSTFLNIPREKIVMMALQRAQMIQDPVQKREAMAVANQAMELYNRVNEEEAYWKISGQLRAKGAYKGQGGGGGGGRGGRGGGGGGETSVTGGWESGTGPGGVAGVKSMPGITPTDLPVTTVPYTVKLHDFVGPIEKFLESDPLYSDPEKTEYGASYVHQNKWTTEDRQAFRERFKTFINQKIRDDTELGTTGFETYAQDFSDEATQAFGKNGLAGFFTTSTKKEGITPQELVITRDVPQDIVFVKRAAKGKKKGEVIESRLNPEAGQKIIGKRIPVWLQGKNASQIGSTQNSEVQGDSGFYLK